MISTYILPLRKGIDGELKNRRSISSCFLAFWTIECTFLSTRPFFFFRSPVVVCQGVKGTFLFLYFNCTESEFIYSFSKKNIIFFLAKMIKKDDILI